jgi:A/G-specific adenine glycosylase
MPGMIELPALPLDATVGREPILRVRHSITNTNYYVSVYAESDGILERQVPAKAETLTWRAVYQLGELPLTGLARKILKRVDLMSAVGLETPERELERRG